MNDSKKLKEFAPGRSVAIMAGMIVSSLAVFLLLGASSPALFPALAAEGDCDIVLGQIANTGEVPAIVINPADETVKIVTSKGSCTETIDSWSKREPLPSPGPSAGSKPDTVKSAPSSRPKTGQPSKPALTSPVPVAPKPSGPPTVVIKPAPVTTPCDLRLTDVWELQIIKIAGIEHYLARMFTLDMDNNNQVDNISFTFISNAGEKKVIHYYGIQGELAGRDYKELTLPDEALIGRLCFGDWTFGKPKYLQGRSGDKSLIVVDKPDLAGQMDAKRRGIEYVPKTEKKPNIQPKREKPFSWALWGSVGGLTVLVAGAAVFVLRRRKKVTGDEDEDEESEEDKKPEEAEEPEEDGDGAKKPKRKVKLKFDLGGIIDSLKKKDGKDEGGEDEDDKDAKDDAKEDGDAEDEGGKPKTKSKFSLGGLFKRKKKKKKDADGEDPDE